MFIEPEAKNEHVHVPQIEEEEEEEIPPPITMMGRNDSLHSLRSLGHRDSS